MCDLLSKIGLESFLLNLVNMGDILVLVYDEVREIRVLLLVTDYVIIVHDYIMTETQAFVHTWRKTLRHPPEVT